VFFLLHGQIVNVCYCAMVELGKSGFVYYMASGILGEGRDEGQEKVYLMALGDYANGLAPQICLMPVFFHTYLFEIYTQG
jgi:hypothetical protein